MRKKQVSEFYIKNWGPLYVPISKKTKKLWGKLSPNAVKTMKKNISASRKQSFTSDDFQRVLEKVSRRLNQGC